MILYFTGTGNSRYAAEILASATGDALHDITPELQSGKAPALHSETPWVVVCPTYAWRMPRVVESFLRGAKLSGSKQMYVIMTCGGSTGNSCKKAKQLAEHIGMSFMGFLSLVMPENYVAMFTVTGEEEAEEMLLEAVPVMKQAAKAILERLPFDAEPASMGGGFLTGVVNPLFYFGGIRDTKFCVTDGCTGCGLCQQVCPMGNIRLKDGVPTWNGACTHCMACIARCPQQVIEYGKITKGKRRWLLERHYEE